MYHIPKYKLQMVREGTHKSSVKDVTDPATAAQLMQEYLGPQCQEHFVVMLLDIKNKVRGIQTVHIGGLNSSIVEPRSVFRSAIVAGNIGSILIGHNHPSGDVTPSAEDITVTRRLRDAGEILGIQVIDHIIVGEGGAYTSFRGRGLL